MDKRPRFLWGYWTSICPCSLRAWPPSFRVGVKGLGCGGMLWEASPWLQLSTELSRLVPTLRLTGDLFQISGGCSILKPHWCSNLLTGRLRKWRKKSSTAFSITCRNLPVEPPVLSHSPCPESTSLPFLRLQMLEEKALPWAIASHRLVQWPIRNSSSNQKYSSSILMEILHWIFKHWATVNR